MARKGQRLTAVQLENMRVGAAKRWSDLSSGHSVLVLCRQSDKQCYQWVVS